MKRIAGVLAAAAVALFVTALPGVAMADDGYRSITTYCDSSESTGGNGWIEVWGDDGKMHAKMRNCKIKWQKNILDGSYWQDVTFEIADTYTDNASALAWIGSNSTLGTCSATGKHWCANGSTTWKAFSMRVTGRTGRFQTALSWGSASTGNCGNNRVAQGLSYAPAGF